MIQKSQSLSAADARLILELVCQTQSACDDPKRWRRELLTGLCKLVNARNALALSTRNHAATGRVMLDLMVDVGWTSSSQRTAYLAHVRKAPLQDPLIASILQKNGHAPGMSMVASQGIAQNGHPHPKHTDLHHEACWLHFGPEPGMTCALRLFRPADDPRPFSSRETLILDLTGIHVARLYLDELKAQTQTHGLSPRARQTLALLQAGKSEKQIAELLHLSTHTVHDYIKLIYRHFNVTTRSELLALFID